MSRWVGTNHGGTGSFPRVSGDEPPDTRTAGEYLQFSPRERG